MPRIQPLLPILRPLSASRTSACRPLCRFSTATRLRVDESSTRTSSTTKPPASPAPTTPASEAARTSPPTSTSQNAARAADLAAAEAATDADSAQAPVPKPNLPSTRSQTATTLKSSATPETSDSAVSTPRKSNTNSGKAKKNRLAKAPEAPKVTLAPAKYHVARTSSKNYPIYTDYKRGGNLHITTVRKITGDLSALREELKVFLNKKDEEVRINALTQHVIVKGHHVPQITEFLKARGM